MYCIKNCDPSSHFNQSSTYHENKITEVVNTDSQMFSAFFVNIQYFSVFVNVIPMLLLVSENIVILVWYWYYQPTRATTMVITCCLQYSALPISAGVHGTNKSRFKNEF